MKMYLMVYWSNLQEYLGHLKSLTNGERVIWPILLSVDKGIGFQTADLISGSYRNHRKYSSLTSALNRSLHVNN